MILGRQSLNPRNPVPDDDDDDLVFQLTFPFPLMIFTILHIETVL